MLDIYANNLPQTTQDQIYQTSQFRQNSPGLNVCSGVPYRLAKCSGISDFLEMCSVTVQRLILEIKINMRPKIV